GRGFNQRRLKCKRCRKILVCCFEGISFIYRFNMKIQAFLEIRMLFLFHRKYPHDIIKAGLE
ncbi:hypothetical protein, partial [Anaerostipes hadrus]|uniref:hypothetical protein n=1 Tax=Anaerostipes hadrus TaxID=649756 RepID=UPI00195A81B6